MTVCVIARYRNIKMKTVILLTFIALSYGAKLERGYLPPQHAQSSSGAEYLETPIVGQIVVDDAAVYHQTDEQHQQVNPGFVRIGSQGSTHAHVTEATIVPQYQQPGHGYVIGSHAGSLAHGVAATIEDSHPRAINGFVNIGSHSSALAHGHEVVENVHYQGQNLKVEHIPERAQAAAERTAAILRQDYKNDGSHYAYVYETENGIFGEEKGVAEHGTRAHGAYSYTGDDGIQYSITYTADENGFHPQGDHLPTPHPIPEEILKSLEQNARDEAAGIYDDGSYRPEKYGEQATYIEHVEHVETPTHVVVNDHSASVHDEVDTVVTNPIVIPEAGLQRPVFRNPALEQVVVNIPTHVIASNVNRGYLPPGHQTILEKRSSQKDKPAFGSKTRQPTLTLKKVKKN